MGREDSVLAVACWGTLKPKSYNGPPLESHPLKAYWMLPLPAVLRIQGLLGSLMDVDPWLVPHLANP